VEVGPATAHLLKFCARYAPDLRIALVDIAPQLTLPEQRCKAIFGDAATRLGSVVGFRTTTTMKQSIWPTFKAGKGICDSRALAMRGVCEMPG